MICPFVIVCCLSKNRFSFYLSFWYASDPIFTHAIYNKQVMDYLEVGKGALMVQYGAYYKFVLCHNDSLIPISYLASREPMNCSPVGLCCPRGPIIHPRKKTPFTPSRRRSAGFQACCIADFQVGVAQSVTTCFKSSKPSEEFQIAFKSTKAELHFLRSSQNRV
jgi:hypothetical protein